SMLAMRLLTALAALGLVLGPATVWAQGPPKPPAGRPGSVLPKTPAEREKTLSDLYALLATADDEESAKAIADAIERVWVHSGSATIDLLMERSIKAMNEKKVDLALKLLDSVVELAPDFTEGWNRRAYVYFVQNDIERALGDLRRTLALDPHHFKALDGLAQILREIGQKKAALEAFKELIDVHPYWSGAKQAIEELEREVEGQGI
ncbi:MAG TPA: tetratricopeptide repeat protein, partial [Hyphomicrobiaceae bacterium]|nr:tetratricopeptide repeat protein [Hyphomicrobiaceae bacterium]